MATRIQKETKERKLIRKINYRMYPNKAETGSLLEALGLHCWQHNTALEERIRLFEETGQFLGYKAQVRAIHCKIARQRHDFYHKLFAVLVSRFSFFGMEKLAIRNMSKKPKAKPGPAIPGKSLPNNAAQKAGLNRDILDTAPSILFGMLLTKAAEAGSKFVKANTLVVKPTQRCHQCGNIVRKELKDRTHVCSCGCVYDRDENAAKTLLRWMLEGKLWDGISRAGVLESLPVLPETPSIATSSSGV